jgi:ribosome-associated translation inhibitor RaiA
MNKNISFKFDVETDNVTNAHGVLDRLVERLRNFQERFPDFKSVEISLHKPDAVAHNKTAVLTLYRTDGCYQEHSSEPEWLTAIDDLFRKIARNIERPVRMY